MQKAKTIYVNINASREGNGSKEMPFKHINDAAKVAQPGDEVIVAPGVYREYVCPVNAGLEDARISYRSEKPLGAVITGAEEIKTWKKYKKDVWTARIKNFIFGSYNPYTEYVYGDWYFAPRIRHTGCVFLNNLAMYETASLDECIKAEADEYAWNAEESRFKWYTEQDGDETVLYANFRGADPNKENVEVTVRRNCFMPDKNYVN